MRHAPFAPIRTARKTVPLSLALILAACPTTTTLPPDDDDTTADPAAQLLTVPLASDWTLPCLSGEVHVLFTEYDHPHVYAANDLDIQCATGFIAARDRWFTMELARRLGVGRLSELLGDLTIENDIEQVSIGGRVVADNLWNAANEGMRAQWDAYAQGVNAYVALVKDGVFPVPQELELAAPFLGFDSPVEFMTEWTARDVAEWGATLVFNLSWETAELSHAAGRDALDHWGDDLALSSLRKAGALQDVWDYIVPVWKVASDAGEAGTTAGWDARSTESRPRTLPGPRVETSALKRAAARGERMMKRMGRNPDLDFGSNAWAIGPEHTASGHTIVAGDGHLPLTVPSLLWEIHQDTALLGGGDLHYIGLTIPGTPAIGLGTNGDVAWSHTWLGVDVNDFYREEVVLTDGRPTATRFQGADLPVTVTQDVYHLDLLTDPRDVTVDRFVQGHGRLFLEMEGQVVGGADDDPLAINVGGTWLVPGDQDGDGIVTAITVAYGGYFEQHVFDRVNDWNRAGSVEEWMAAHAGTSYGQNFAVGDSAGNVAYSSYQAVPCRGYLPRDGDGVPIPGANPQMLLDGTVYPSWTAEYAADGLTYDPHDDDELKCVYAYDEWPNITNPTQGYVVTANNAPHGAGFDNDLWNDPIYIGGPWYANYRAHRIGELIETQSGTIDVEMVSAQQGDHESQLARYYLDELLDALSVAEGYAADGEVGDTEAGRLAAMWAGNSARLEEARDRLNAWAARGFVAEAGVETFYDAPDADRVADSIATTIWNMTVSRFQAKVWDDEGLPSIWRPSGRQAQARSLDLILRGRGAGNPLGLASWNPDTEESVFFDVVGTELVETSREDFVAAMVEALDFLETSAGADRSGGFGSSDMNRWKWGLKHWVHFDSVLKEVIGDDPTFEPITSQFAITPAVIPLDDPAPVPGDQRYALPGFPRPGDAFAVDAAGGTCRTGCGYGSGPVMRIVMELDPGGMKGVNVLPGGQSADPDSPYFADQAALWIANEAFPLRFSVDDVVTYATRREVLHP